MEHTGDILILSGPPGSGKTTTARALAAGPGTPKVHLHCDDFWRQLGAGAIAPWLPEAEAQNTVVMNAIAAAAAAFARGGYHVIVDGIVGPWFLQPFRRTGVPTRYVVLRPTLEESVSRCVERGGDTLHHPATVKNLHAQLSDLGMHERHALPVDGMTAEEIVATIRKAMRNPDSLLAS